MKPKFDFSRAELNGLIAYVRQFGKDAIPKLPLSVRWSPRDGVLTATCTGGGYTVEVLLERVFAEEWEGVCSCKEELGCKHCLATAAYALGLPLGRPAAEAVGGLAAKTKPTSNPRDDIANLVKAALGREITPGEKEYIDAVRSARQKYILSHTFNLQDMISLAWDPAKPEVRPLPHLLSRANVGRWFPTQPESLLDFYHGVVRTLGFLGLRPAGFMAEVLKSNPPPPEWVKAWERDATSRWQSSLESAVGAGVGSVIPDHTAAADSRKLGLRLRLMAGSPAAEIRLAESEPWRIPKKTELKELLQEVQALRLATEAECAPLVFSIIRILSDPMRPELSYARGYSYVEGDSKVAVLLGKAQTRASIVCDDGTPVEAALRPATWKLVPSEFAADGSPSHFDLEPRLDDGSPVPIPIAIAEGNPIWFVTASSVHRIPQLPESLPHLQHIPAEVLQDATAIEALHHLGVDLPEQLTARIRRVPLKPVLSLNLQDAGKGQRLIAGAFAHDIHGRVVEQLHDVNWVRVKPKGRPPKNSIEPGSIVIPVRSHAAVLEGAIEGLQAKWDPYARHFALRITKRFPDEFHAWLQSIPPEVQVELPPELAHFTQAPVEAQFQLQVAETQVDWFDLSATITTGDPDLTPEELQLLLDAEGSFVNLPGKGWRRVRVTLSPEDQQHLAELGLETSSISSEPLRLHALQLNNPAAKRVLPEAQAAHVQRRADEIQARVTPPVPGDIQASLRPYQLDGFHFLAYLSQNNFGGVLADDMGLGKTLQTLTWLAWLRSQAEGTAAGRAARARHVLIVCPKSVLPNWQAEAKRFLPALRVTAWSGVDPASIEADLANHDALVVNYAQLRLLEEVLAARTWLAVILDEAQYIKNPDSQTAQAARRMVALHRLALTGTPIENRLLDLWSILAFAMPGALGPRAQFQRSYGKDDPFARRRLAARLRPFLLRRTKAQVAQDLPDRIEEDVLCTLEGVQKALYTAEYKKARALLLGIKTKSDLDKFRFHFLTSLLRLRQICCHAALVDPKHRKQPSAKLEALLELLEPILAQGLKVLVFSQFTGMLDVLQEALGQKDINTFILTGETEDRGPLVDAFNQHPGAAVFLISLKAGGFGLNLTSASYVVLFDPWWNPAVENQAIDRTHRIGQKATVFAYRLVVQGSIEEKIRQLQRSKSALAQDILGEERFSQALSIDDLQFLFESPEAAV